MRQYLIETPMTRIQRIITDLKIRTNQSHQCYPRIYSMLLATAYSTPLISAKPFNLPIAE